LGWALRRGALFFSKLGMENPARGNGVLNEQAWHTSPAPCAQGWRKERRRMHGFGWPHIR
jgi:hypothetical protein